jgi:hypothetical protein
VLLLVVAAGVAGFALSQYFLASHSSFESAALRSELQTQLAEIRSTAARLERASAGDRGAGEHAEDARRAAGAVTVTTTIGPCHPRAIVASDAAPVCTEPEAVLATLCGSVPASAVVTAMILYARPEESPQSWADSQAAPGQELGRARFAEKPFERPESDQAKQACTKFSVWDAEHAYSARLVVSYAPAPALSSASESPRAIAGPLSEQR